MKSLVSICLVFGIAFSVSAQKRGQARIDSLLQELKPSQTDTIQARILIELSFAYNSIDPDKGLSYGNKARELAETLRWKEGISDAYRAIGVNHSFGKSEFPESLDAFSKSLEIAEETGNREDAAKVYNNIGVVYWFLSDFPNALDHYFKALQIHEEMGRKDEMANSLTNIGLVYNSQKDYPKALEYLLKGNALDEELGNKQGIASNLGNLGQIYANLKQYDKALEYDSNALVLYTELGDKNGIARNLGNLGGIYSELGDHAKAMEYHLRALALNKEIGLQVGIAATYGAIGTSYLAVARKKSPETLRDFFKGNISQALEKAHMYTDSAIVIGNEIGDLNRLINMYQQRSEIQTLQGNYQGALESYRLYTINKDSVFTLEKDKKLTESAMQYAFDQKVAIAKAEQDQKDLRNRAIRNFILTGLFGALVFVVILLMQRKKIIREKQRSDAEKRRSDELLLNILPQEVANELKNTGTARAKAFSMVTVMLADFKDYTKVSEQMSAELLVAEIHECFSAFDHITQKYGVEKIKTIGDAYLCASGVPVPSDSHAIDMLHAAFEIRDFMQKRRKAKDAQGQLSFDIRIGMHTGPVVAGIVGVKKYAYDIWGDTVNLAARMESGGEAGKINVSQSTYELVKDHAECTYRGKIEAKNKGLVNMYFVEPKPEHQRT